MTPCIVLDLETTGFLLKRDLPDGWNARVIEVGAVVVTADRRIVSPISPLVRQPRRLLEHPRSRRAARVHRIPTEAILAAELDGEQAAERLVRWAQAVALRHGVREVRGWNQSFDFRFLEAPPWRFFERSGLGPGEDIARVARRRLGTFRGGLEGALSALGMHNPRAHRALYDARAAAEVLLACDRPATR